MRQDLAEMSFKDLPDLVTKGYGNTTRPLAAKILELINSIPLAVPAEQMTGRVAVKLIDRATIEVGLSLEYECEYEVTHGRKKRLLKRPRRGVETVKFEKTVQFKIEMYPLNPHQAIYLGLTDSWGHYYNTQWALAEDLLELAKAPAGLFGGAQSG